MCKESSLICKSGLRTLKIVHRTVHTYEKSSTVVIIIEIELILFSINHNDNNHKDL